MFMHEYLLLQLKDLEESGIEIENQSNPAFLVYLDLCEGERF